MISLKMIKSKKKSGSTKSTKKKQRRGNELKKGNGLWWRPLGGLQRCYWSVPQKKREKEVIPLDISKEKRRKIKKKTEKYDFFYLTGKKGMKITPLEVF